MKWEQVSKVDRDEGQRALDRIIDPMADNHLDVCQTLQLLALMLEDMERYMKDQHWIEWDYEQSLDDIKANGLIE